MKNSEIENKNKRVDEINELLSLTQDKFNILRKEIQYRITMSHNIICVTCISSIDMMPKEFWKLKKDYSNSKDCFEEMGYRVIIDEAAQAIEPEILIPLLGAEQVVLIGDHRQLGPVLHMKFEEQAVKNQIPYTDSLFYRL